MPAMLLSLIALAPQGALDPSHQSWSQFLGVDDTSAPFDVQIAEGVGLTWCRPGTSTSNVVAFATGAAQPTVVYTAAATTPRAFAAARDTPTIVVYENNPLSLVAYSTADPQPIWTWPLPGIATLAAPQLAITPDGAFVATLSGPFGSPVMAHVLDGTTGIELERYASPYSVITELQLADDGSRLLVDESGVGIQVLALPGLLHEVTLTAFQTIVTDAIDRVAETDLTPDDLRVRTRTPEGTWPVTLVLPGVAEWPVTFSGDGETLVTRAANGDLVLRDLAAGGAVLASHGPPASFWEAVVDTTGERVAVHMQPDQLLQVIDRQGAVIADEDALANQPTFMTSDFDLSSDGRFVGVVGSAFVGFDDRRFAVMLDLDLSPLAYCQPKLSSSLCWSLLSAGPGSNPTSGAGDFVVTADTVEPQRPGLFFYGLAGPADAPFLGGTLCVNPPLGRTPPQFSGGTVSFACDGTFALVLNDGTSPYDAPGNKVWVQAWYRDPLNGPGSLGTALSNALEITFD